MLVKLKPEDWCDCLQNVGEINTRMKNKYFETIDKNIDVCLECEKVNLI